MSVIQSGDLYLNNAYASVWALTRYDSVTGQYVPLTGATCTVELVDGANVIAATALPETAVAGTYATTIAASAITTAFSSSNIVMEIVRVGTSAVFQRPLVVQSVRYVP